LCAEPSRGTIAAASPKPTGFGRDSRTSGRVIRDAAGGRAARGTQMVISGGRVLVIDDDEGMREAIESLLGAAGYAAMTYASAEVLLAEAIPEDVRCIVSDVRLPEMSGLDLITELRARGARLPVILITGHDSPSLRREAELRGAAVYLPKPFARSALLTAIESAMNTAAARGSGADQLEN
jgi:FixJ family two-component response regulator